ncbi:hypothetical protein [Desulfobacula sp.]|uniref:hypothetical protein n=1 Tax=Desulfobacula sp. TaxID=2593537 RepID=UPI00271551DF|nr:hypothetical protein [Desulfobacula sp.]
MKKIFFSLFFICLCANLVYSQEKLKNSFKSEKAKNLYTNNGYLWKILTVKSKHAYLKGLIEGVSLLSEKIVNSKMCSFDTIKQTALVSYFLKLPQHSISKLSIMIDVIYQDNDNLEIPIPQIYSLISKNIHENKKFDNGLSRP